MNKRKSADVEIAANTLVMISGNRNKRISKADEAESKNEEDVSLLLVLSLPTAYNYSCTSQY